MSKQKTDPIEYQELKGALERITFQNPENDFSIAKLKVASCSKPVPILGVLRDIYPGEILTCKGHWLEDAKYGRQFKVASFEKAAPMTLEGIMKYLSCGKIQGIGPKFAQKIVDKFGLQTLLILEKDPKKLLEIEGMGRKKLDHLVHSLQEQKEVQEIFVFLQSHEVTLAYAQRIYKAYGSKSIQIVQNNPYQVAQDIKGIGFKLADRIAMALKIAPDSSQRICSCIEYLLEELSSQGHTCYPKYELQRLAEELLGLIIQGFDSIIDQMISEKRLDTLTMDNTLFVALRTYYLSEKGAACELKRLQDSPCAIRDVDQDKALQWVESQLKLKFAKAQKEAIKVAMKEKILIITGGPGTGKSTITKAILKISSKLTSRITCAAPTGRAAKRMTEITYYKASTLHSLLKFDFKSSRFVFNANNPLPSDLIIIDEASMIDARLFYHLLRAIPSQCRLILIGDIDQLPSVGAGNVLRDLISSEKIEVTRLSYIFRQGKGSKIAYNAFLINQGYFPKLEYEQEDDFNFYEAKEPEQVLAQILDQVHHQLPQKYSFDPIKEIQVLAPMKKGAIGSDQLNTKLQKLLNPSSPSITWSGKRFCIGDKVMQMKNNYQKEISNGDIGIIDHIDTDQQELSIQFDNKKISYSFSELQEVQLAYCVSIHKYQGSESPCIVMPVHTHHFKLLCRNLLYTGITRGKKRVVLVGTKKAVAIAVKNNEILHRHTAIAHFLNH